MKSIKHFEQLHQLHQKIQNQNTGTPKEVAVAMKMSERSLHNLILDLKMLGAEIGYSRTQKTYYYFNDFKIEIDISLKIIQDGNARNIYGGSFFKKKAFTAKTLQGTLLLSQK